MPSRLVKTDRRFLQTIFGACCSFYQILNEVGLDCLCPTQYFTHLPEDVADFSRNHFMLWFFKFNFVLNIRRWIKSEEWILPNATYKFLNSTRIYYRDWRGWTVRSLNPARYRQEEIFLFYKKPRPALGPTRSHTGCVS